MDVGDIRFYKERWKAVEEIERQELRAAPIEKHWKQLNEIIRRGKRLGFERDNEKSEMEIFLRWAKLKGAK